MVINETERMSIDQIEAELQNIDVRRYNNLQRYYEAKNTTIIEDGINNARNRQNPNNIIPLPIARKTINDVVGYAYKQGNVEYNYINADENSEQLLKSIMTDNDEALTSSELFTTACIKGESAEVLYFQDGKIYFAEIPIEQCVFRYNNTIKQDTLDYSIRFYETESIDSYGRTIIIINAVVYTDTYVHYYEKELNSNKKTEFNYIDSEPHLFGKVPLYPYKINKNKTGLFEPSISIIDKLDQLGSDSIANAIDQFNDTILLVSKQITQSDAEKIKDLKIMDGLGTKDQGNFVEFLQRNLDINGTLESTKVFERWYYEFTGIPNLNNDSFGLKTGVAMAYALIPFENTVSLIESYFSRGLLYRIELIQNALQIIFQDYVRVEIGMTWVRNLPFDFNEFATMIKTLKEIDLISDESLLKMFPAKIINDVQQELELKAEQDENRSQAETNYIENTLDDMVTNEQ